MNKRRRYLRYKRSKGLWDVLGSIGKTVGSAAKSAAPIIGSAAKSIGTNVLKPGMNYLGKNADTWVPPLMNATSQLVSAKIRQRAMKDLKKAEEKHNENIGKLDEPDEEFTDEELKKLLKELQGFSTTAPRGTPTSQSINKGSGIPQNISQGLRQTVRATGVKTGPLGVGIRGSGIIRL